MPVKQYSTFITQVMAMQLIIDGAHDNIREIAMWCQDEAQWEYSDKEKTLVGAIWIGTNPMRMEPGDWLVRNNNGEFEVVKDTDFKKRFDTEAYSPRPVCQYCLSDTEKTPLGDEHEKRCPVCGCAYNGGRRSKEFATLVAAGLVARDD